MKSAATDSKTRTLLEIQDLRTYFETARGLIPAVDGVSLTIPQGRTVALVGESGCGKSVTALSVLRLIPQPPGRILGGRIVFNDTRHHEATPDPRLRGDDGRGQAPPRSHEATKGASHLTKVGRRGVLSTFDTRHSTFATSLATPPLSDGATEPIDLLQISDQAMRRIRGNRIAMIFQEPMAALNPVFSIGEQIVEAVELHQGLCGKAAWAAAVEALRRVGIPDAARRSRDYPHQLSGGMRQRAMIAMALSCKPALFIADEPTTALDVTVQRQILELLRTIQTESGMSILLITHDFGVVAEAADEVYVMYAGRIVEHGPVAEVLAHPLHPYTQGLIRCTPRLSLRKARLEVIPGTVPDPRRPPGGCRFHPRCSLSAERARTRGCADWCENPFSHQPARRETVPVKSEIPDTVLRRCVEEYPAEPSGTPALREVGSNHFVACWEAERPQ